ncbi:MAG: hypothetical protein IT273_07445 [Chitinophagales bacterium]|nr:hypothetical protein [Chitinophagales bacterium]
MKKAFLILMLFLGACTPTSPAAKKVAASKVKLIFSNESPYPIGKIKVTTLPPLNLGEEDIAKYGDLQILTIPIPPQCSDTVLLNSFNRLAHIIQVSFLVGNDTIEKRTPTTDYHGNYMMTSGTLWYKLHYSDKRFLDYTREVIE